MLTGHNVFLQLSEGSPAERAHQEVILAFMSMIDDTEMEAGFEKIPRAGGGANCLDSSPQRGTAFASL